jgi:hypothetical protein
MRYGESMGKKQITGPDGSAIEGEIISVNSSSEHWNQYLLEDGTVMKLKCVLMDVLRSDSVFDNDGNPMYVVKTQNVVTVDVPDKLKKGSK